MLSDTCSKTTWSVVFIIEVANLLEERKEATFTSDSFQRKIQGSRLYLSKDGLGGSLSHPSSQPLGSLRGRKGGKVQDQFKREERERSREPGFEQGRERGRERSGLTFSRSHPSVRQSTRIERAIMKKYKANLAVWDATRVGIPPLRA